MTSHAQPLRPLDRFSELPLYRQVELQLEELIRRENLQPREALPSLTTLQRELGANHVTIRRAIRELAHRNIVVTRQGRGTFVAEGAVRKVLWVCGLDIFGGEISAYYTDLLRFTSEALAAHEIAVEPAWLPKQSPQHSQRYASETAARSYLGYLFVAAHEHPLLSFVTEQNLPYVNMSFATHPRSRTVIHDILGADRLAVQHLVERGHRQISLLGFPPQISKWIPDLEQAFDVELSLCETCVIDDTLKRASDVEHRAFVNTASLLAEDRLHDAIYIGDEIAARGATRAMLAFTGRARARDIIVRSARQEIMPMGLPVQYVAFDVQEQARQAVRVLLNQINHVTGEPDHYACSYALLDHAALEPSPATQTHG